MLISIETSPIGPLKVLADLPNARLAILEGLNGIGKTLAVRLLQICAGTVPYATDSADWESLCAGLGTFRVRVRSLQGADELMWAADSRKWQVGSGLGARAVEFDDVRIDGKSASLEDARRLLAVERVAGDEDLIEVLAQNAEAEAEVLRRWGIRYAGAQEGPLAALEELAASAQARLSPWTPEQFAAAQEESSRLKEELHRLNLDAAAAEDVRMELESGSVLKARLAELRNRAPGLEQRIREIDEAISTARSQRHSLDAKISELAAKAAMAGPALRELKNARRTLARNRADLEDNVKRAAAIAGTLGLADRDAAKLSSLITEARQQLAHLSEAQTNLDATPTLRVLLDSVSAEFSEAEMRGLGTQIALEDPDSRLALTVSQTRAGILTRRARLADQPSTPEARDVAAKVASKRVELNRLLALEGRDRETDRYRRLVAENEDRVSRALLVANVEASEQMREAEGRRRDSDDALLELAAERAGLQEQLGSPGGESTEESLASQLDELLERQGVTMQGLDAGLQRAAESVGQLKILVARLSEASDAARREIERIEADTFRAAEELASPMLAWLAGALGPSRLAPLGSTVLQHLTAQRRASLCLEVVLDRLGGHRAQLGALTNALQNAASHLRGGDSQDVRYREQVEQWLGARYSEWFNIGPVRRELFPDATGPVSVDVGRRRVLWNENGAEMYRPLQAFSSGEQAFAYTRARIGALDDQEASARNRLVVLDEFGAFISHDRLGRLLEYLRGRVEEHPDDQVLVILPLTREYDELARTAIGEDGARYSELAAQVEVHNFAVQVLA